MKGAVSYRQGRQGDIDWPAVGRRRVGVFVCLWVFLRFNAYRHSATLSNTQQHSATLSNTLTDPEGEQREDT